MQVNHLRRLVKQHVHFPQESAPAGDELGQDHSSPLVPNG